MSDKKLLEEGTIRRFQMLANIKSVNSEVLEEGSKKKKGNMEEAKPGKKGPEVKKESLEETLEEKAVEEGSLEETYKEAGVAEEGNTMEEAEEGGDEGGEVRSALQDIEAGVNKLLGMIEGGAGLEIGVEDEEPEGEEGMGGEGEMEMPPAGEEEGSLEEENSLMEAIKAALSERRHAKDKDPKHKKAMEEKKKLEEKKKAKKEMEEKKELEESIEVVDDDVLAEELTKRVAARLVAEMKKAKMVKEGGKGGVNWYKTKSGGNNRPKPGGKVGKGTPFK